jgi:ESCRT-II complex subunit VPS36
MELFNSVPLSIVGKPILLDEEVEVKVETSTRILLNKGSVDRQDLFGSTGTLILTNFRLVNVVYNLDEGGKKKSIGWGINLSRVHNIQDCAGIFRRSTRLELFFNDSRETLSLKFEVGKVPFLESMKTVLERRSWEYVKPKEAIAEEKHESKFSVANAGVGGLQRRQERDLQAVGSVARDATADLDSLMRSARDAVNLIQRYAAYAQERDDTRSDPGDETTTQAGERTEMDAILQSIGIVSPVTKFSAGRAYHAELSRQLADVLLRGSALERLGGTCTLTDVYCIFNRARGTELVSPDDFYKASEMLESLNVGLKLKRFRSGVKIIQLAKYSDEMIGSQIREIAEEKENVDGIDASEIAKRLNVSVVVAKERLIAAESGGFLCRDESIDGLFFYPNLFQ